MIKLPLEERPRERLLYQGVDALRLSELLAIILGSGTKGFSVIEVAEKLLNHFGGLENLVDASISELMQIKGIGKVKAIELKAVFGLAKKLLATAKKESAVITSSKEAYQALVDFFYGEKQELLAVLLLDTKLKPIHREIIGRGTLTEVLVHPREVFAPALRHRAPKLIIAHNHPSQDLTPSPQDLKFTQILKSCGELMDIPLIDHLIVTDHGYISLKDRNLL